MARTQNETFSKLFIKVKYEHCFIRTEINSKTVIILKVAKGSYQHYCDRNSAISGMKTL